MSTGPVHYIAAERLLADAARDVSENYVLQTGEHKADLLAAAQVHATLALAAATYGMVEEHDSIISRAEWRDALEGESDEH